MVCGKTSEQAGGDEGSGGVDADQHPERGLAPVGDGEMGRDLGRGQRLAGVRQHHSTRHQPVHALLAHLDPAATAADADRRGAASVTGFFAGFFAVAAPSRPNEIARTAAALGKQRVSTKEQALAIDMAPGIKDTAEAEIFYWQLTGLEWDGSSSHYHSRATRKWHRLRQSDEKAASARDANALQHAEARGLQQMAEQIDNTLGVKIVGLVAVVMEQTIKHYPSMLSDDLREGGAQLITLAAELESVLPMPLTGNNVVTRSVGIGRSMLLALRMLCELEDSFGVPGLDPDWNARPEHDLFPRVNRLLDTVQSWT